MTDKCEGCELLRARVETQAEIIQSWDKLIDKLTARVAVLEAALRDEYRRGYAEASERAAKLARLSWLPERDRWMLSDAIRALPPDAAPVEWARGMQPLIEKGKP